MHDIYLMFCTCERWSFSACIDDICKEWNLQSKYAGCTVKVLKILLGSSRLPQCTGLRDSH